MLRSGEIAQMAQLGPVPGLNVYEKLVGNANALSPTAWHDSNTLR
jgi:hypothetical protein